MNKLHNRDEKITEISVINSVGVFNKMTISLYISNENLAIQNVRNKKQRKLLLGGII